MEETKYGMMNPPHLMPVDGTKVLAYAQIHWDIGYGSNENAEWVVVERKKSTCGIWYDDVVHASGHVLHCKVLGWFPLPSKN